MSALQVVGLLMMAAAVASLAMWAARGPAAPEAVDGPAGSSGEVQPKGELQERLARRVRNDRLRSRRRWVYANCAVLAAGFFLLLYTAQPPSGGPPGVPPAPVQQTPLPGVQLQPCLQVAAQCPGTDSKPASRANVSGAVWWPWFGIAGLALVAGVVLLIFGKDLWAKLLGTGAMVAGVAGGGSLIHEVKFGDLLKFEMENQIEAVQVDFRRKLDIDIDAKIEARLAELGAIGPQRLTYLQRFEPGSATLARSMDGDIERACRVWTERTGQGLVGLVLVIGATDRVPLVGAARFRYESNFGLARARAEAVRTRLGDDCSIPPGRMLALVSGPRNTPESGPSPRGEKGYPDDRRVDVWALWSWPTPEQSRTSPPVPGGSQSGGEPGQKRVGDPNDAESSGDSAK